MTGEVDESGTPILRLTVAGREWIATIDTGFNGDLELPQELAHYFSTKYVGESSTTLAGGKVIEENLYAITFPFDDRMLPAEVAFAKSDGILIGTRLLREYRLEVNFVTRVVLLERVGAT